MPTTREQSSQHYHLHSPLNFEPAPPSADDRDSPEMLADTIAAEAIREVNLPRGDWSRLRGLPWGAPLDDWADLGVPLLPVRRGESRHPVLFVERAGRRYALKETSPRAAKHEAAVLQTLRQRDILTLQPVGTVIVRDDRIYAGTIMGRPVYESGDVGYMITRLAERVLPQSILYRYPFTLQNKRILWNAVAGLLVRLHQAGVFWGDPSLANILIEFSGRQIRAVLADAETVEVHDVTGDGQTGLSEGMRRQDLEILAESLLWQGEDIRQARGLSNEAALVGEEDIAYIESRYAGLRAERAQQERHGEALTLPAFADALTSTLSSTVATRLRALEVRIQHLASLGYGLRSVRWLPAPSSGGAGGRRAWGTRRSAEEDLAPAPPGAGEAEISAGILRPSWYVRRLRELLGEDVPRAYAWRLFYHLNIHKWLLSERAGHDVGFAVATADWRAHIHDPLQAFLRTYLPDVSDHAERYAAEANILDRGWQLSQAEASRPVPVEEAALDYALGDARAALARSDASGPEGEPDSTPDSTPNSMPDAALDPDTTSEASVVPSN